MFVLVELVVVAANATEAALEIEASSSANIVQ